MNETWFCLRRSPSPKLSTPALLLTTVSPLTFDCSKAAIRFSGIPHRPNPVKKNASEFIMKCSLYQYVCTLSVNMIGIDWKGIGEIMTDYTGIRTQAPWISSQIFTYWAIWLQRLNQSDHDSIMKTFKLKKRCQRVFHYRSVTSIIDKNLCWLLVIKKKKIKFFSLSIFDHVTLCFIERGPWYNFKRLKIDLFWICRSYYSLGIEVLNVNLLKEINLWFL